MTRLIFFLFILLSFHTSAENIEGKWKFDNIFHEKDKSKKNIKPVSTDDFMIIKNDGTFSYELKKANINASGRWTFDAKKNLLSLFYINTKKMSGEKAPSLQDILSIDTIRYYKVTFKKNTLILNENQINYTFKKEDLISVSKAKPTEGITFKSILRGTIGILALLFIAYLFSRNRKKINWRLVFKGLSIQLIFALLILKVPIVYNFFKFISELFTKIISFTNEGSQFLFGSLMDENGSWGYIFAFQVLPTVVFFSALTSLFYYWKIIPRIVYAFAWIMKKTLKLSGPESVAAAGNIFLGQTEAPLLVKPYLNKMTNSEIMCLMCGGMATIAGGVLAAFIGILGEEFAIHLIMASVMSAPAAVVAAKILVPETEKYDNSLKVSLENKISNELEAISQGTIDGLKLAINVGAMLLVFTAFIYLANYVLLKFGTYTDINSWILKNTRYPELSFNMILGYIGAPVAWLIGVCKEDMFLVGQLLGEKTVLNEFVAYLNFGEMKNENLFTEKKSIIITTYVLCGFANFASIGIQIGGIGSLAPKRRTDLSRLGILSLIGGTLACLFTGVIVGMII